MSDITPPSSTAENQLAQGQTATPQDINATVAAYEAEVLTKCQTDLADLQAKSAELADQYLRAKADIENARRRAEDDVAKARKFAIEGFADSLLPVLDSLEAGLTIKDATVDVIREARRQPFASWWPHWSETRSSPSIRLRAASSIRTCTKLSAWSPRIMRPIRSSPCCKKAI